MINKVSLSKSAFFILSLILSSISISQAVPPCPQVYGNPSDVDSIQFAMAYGSINDVQTAIDTAKSHRGLYLGCFQNADSYSAPNFAEPSLATIQSVWVSNHAPAIDVYVLACPEPGRNHATVALGGYYARLAGVYSNLPPLGCIGKMMEAQQYSDKYANLPLVAEPGMFSYLSVPNTDPCYPGGAISVVVDSICLSSPSYCVTYNAGLFSANTFAVADLDFATLYGVGGGAYDQGWAGICMIESAIQQTDPILKDLFKSSAILAGDWSVNEYPVYNHNYTAKLIWLLSELYAWTGDSTYKANLIDKLERNLIPGVMMDVDLDGLVDGTNVALSSLTIPAQTQGRMWDGHNAQPQYQSMNTYAMIEAYVAFRDQGDTTMANQLRPYAIAMLDNLANEINTLGTPGIGVSQVTYALLIGLWKVAEYENEVHADWETAAWAQWNTGTMNSFGANTVNVGLYLLLQSDSLYTPLFDRETYYAVSTPELINADDTYVIFPNPAKDEIHIQFIIDHVSKIAYRIYDLRGRRIAENQVPNHDNSITIDTREVESGTYIIEIYTDHYLETGRFIVE